MSGMENRDELDKLIDNVLEDMERAEGRLQAIMETLDRGLANG